MNYRFEQLDFPSFDNTYSELVNLIDTKISFHKKQNQICINTVSSAPDDIHYGCGSLLYDWDNARVEEQPDGGVKNIVPKRDVELKEEDFTVLNSQFKGTVFEELYNILNKNFILGRIRLMQSQPSKCLSWHCDNSPRIHYPVKTQEGCFMVIEDEVKFLPENTWWKTNTLKPHTAFNASKENRIHLVAVLLGER